MANEEREDLSQLEGPVTQRKFCEQFLGVGIAVFIGFGTVLMIALKLVDAPTGLDFHALKWITVPLALLVASWANFHWWWKYNYLGHKVWWWKGEDGKWQVTAKEYPAQALGLVIEVHVRAKPSFRLMWGEKGWWCAKRQEIIGNGYRGFLSNRDGELVAFATWNNIPPGLSKEVVELLCNLYAWRIVPRDAGRVLRFEDNLGIGLEIRHIESDVDLEEILWSIACFEYRMQQRNGASNLRNERDYAQGERDALKNEREETWQWLCCLLNHLREQVRATSRPLAKIVALETIGWILTRLLAELPADHQLRRDCGVSVEELERVRAALATERGKVGRRGGPSPRPSPTEERGE